MRAAKTPTPFEFSEPARLEQRYEVTAGGTVSGLPERIAPTMGSTTLWGWKAIVYALVLGFASLLLVPLTDLWWIVPLLGAATPIALLAAAHRGGDREGMARRRAELWAAVATYGTLTPLDAARLTSCTATEAAQLMESLASEGALTRLPGGQPTPIDPQRSMPLAVLTSGEEAALTPSPSTATEVIVDVIPEAPLSERELEVLTLLAAGRTNAEVARDLFISIGTVKSHSGNIYRKLGARNRPEAIARARQAGLIP